MIPVITEPPAASFTSASKMVSTCTEGLTRTQEDLNLPRCHKITSTCLHTVLLVRGGLLNTDTAEIWTRGPPKQRLLHRSESCGSQHLHYLPACLLTCHLQQSELMLAHMQVYHYLLACTSTPEVMSSNTLLAAFLRCFCDP